MTLNEALEQLKALGDEKRRAHNTRCGAGDNQFGVKHGDIRVLAKKIMIDHELAGSLWETGNVDAQLLAILLVKPGDLPAEEVDRIMRTITFEHVADWLVSYVVRHHPDKEALRQEWMAADCAVDDEHHPRGDRNQLPRPPQFGHRHRGEAGNLPGLPGVEGLHLTLRTDLDKRNGRPPG